MKNYLLRNIPAKLWKAAKLQAAEEDTTLREIILRAIGDYLSRVSKHYKSEV